MLLPSGRRRNALEAAGEHAGLTTLAVGDKGTREYVPGG